MAHQRPDYLAKDGGEKGLFSVSTSQVAAGFRELADELDGGDVSVRSLVARGFDINGGLIIAPTSDGKGYPVAHERALHKPNDEGGRRERMLLSTTYERAWRRWLEAAVRIGDESAAVGGLTAMERNALNESVSEDGGFAVPATFHAELLSRVSAQAVVRPRATVIPTMSASTSIPAVVPDDGDPTVYASRWLATWGGETSFPDPLDPQFENFHVSTKKLRTPILLVSWDLVADTDSLLAQLLEMGSRDLAAAEDAGFLIGDGGSFQPRGALNSGLTEAAAGAPTEAGLKGLVEALPEQYRRGARWCMNRVVEGDARAIVDAGSNAVYPRDRGATIEGFPVDLSPFMPSNRVILMAWAQYIITQRSLRVRVLTERYADEMKTGLGLIERVGGGVWDTAAGQIGTVG